MTIKRKEYSYNGRKVVLDTALLGSYYETMLFYASNGKAIDERHAKTETDALRDFDEISRKYPETAKSPALTGKYAKLRDDLVEMAKIGREVANDYDDGGTCNFDAPSIYLPYWRVELVERAAKEAGCACTDGTLYGRKRYVFCPSGIHGQANKRAKAADAMTDFLQAAGYDALCYCEMD